MIHHAIRWTKWITLAFLLLCFTLVVLLATLLYTQPGLNMMVWGAQKALPQLQVEDAEGALLPGFTLSGVRYQDESLFIDMQARSISLGLHPNCFLEPSVCITKLAIDGLDFSMPQLPAEDPNAPPAPDSEPVTSISSPIPILLGNLSLSDIKLDILGNKVRWQRFTTAASFKGDVLKLSPTTLEDIVVALAPPAEPDAEPALSPTAATEPAPIVLPEVWIPLTVDVAGIDVRRFTLQQETPLVVNHLGLKAFAKGYQVRVDKLALDMPQIKADLKTQVELRQGYPLTLDATALVREEPANGQELALSVGGSVKNLTVHAELGGVVESQVEAKLQPLEPTLPFDVLIDQTKAQWPLTGKGDYFVDLKKLSASGSLEGYQVALAASAQGKDVPDTEVSLEGKGDIKQIELTSLNINTLGGDISGNAFANWDAPINWRAAIKLANIQPGLQWPEAEGNISGELKTSGSLSDQGGWQVDLPMFDIDGVLRDYPLNFEGSLTASDKAANGDIRLSTPGIVLSHGPNRVTAEGELNKQWQMNLAIDFPQLAKSVPDLAGRVQGNVALRGKLAEPDVNLLLNVNDVKWKDEATLKTLRLQGDVTPLPQVKANVTLTAQDATYQDNRLDSLALAVTGGQASHNLTLDLASNLASVSLALNGSLKEKPVMDWRGQLERAEITSQQGTWNLAKPTGLGYNLDKQLAAVSAHCWLQGDASLCLDKDIQVGEQGEAQLSLKQFRFSQLTAFIPDDTQLQGEVNANVWAKWAPNKPPQAKVTVEMPKGQVAQKLDAPLVFGWDSVLLTANVANDQLDAQWRFDVTDNGDVSGQISIPKLSSEQREMNGNLKLSTFNLDFLAPVVGEYSQVQSNIETDLTFSGPMLEPKVYGEMLVRDIMVAGDISPVEVQSGQVVTQFNGDTATLNASINTPDGELKATGDANWRDLSAWDVNLRVFADELKVDLPPMVKVKVVPDMTISVTPELAKVSGNIGLPWGRIEVKDLPPSAVSVSKDQVLLNKELQPLNGDEGVPFKLETNVTINIGDDFRLSAFGLQGNLVGDLKVTQQEKGTYIVGEVNIRDGKYRSFGQELIIQEGKILMNGPVDQPYVAITAVRDPDNTQDDVTAGVKVTGPADQPTITIFSDPAMPQANALSYLLRGQDIGAESDGNAMYTALIGLSLAKSGKVVGEIGEAFGVQDLQLDTQGSGDDSQVTVSGYILPGLQVKYGVGIFDSVGEFTVRYRLMKDLYLEAVSGIDSAVDLLYQFEFD